MEDNEKKYPVIYYDLNATDLETVQEISDQVAAYFEREKVPFILLPKDVMVLKWLNKEEVLYFLKNIIKEVEEWQ